VLRHAISAVQWNWKFDSTERYDAASENANHSLAFARPGKLQANPQL
jgi:hypothetical protein